MSDEDIRTDEVRELENKEARPDNTAEILNEKRILTEPLTNADARRRMAAYSRRGFLVGGAAALLGVFGWRWMSDETKQHLLRRSFEFNEWVSQNLYSPKRLAPEFSPDQITPERVNGMEGLGEGFDPATWRLTISGLSVPGVFTLTLDDLKRMPRTEMITEFKCIEGWSLIQHWAGVRFSEIAARYVNELYAQYVSISTPDGGYFVGWDIQSIMHPQTLLAYELNGKPLTPEHGAPLRLASPLKYGIKQIKRIGRIEFTDQRPRDYWAEDGYDWYAGH